MGARSQIRSRSQGEPDDAERLRNSRWQGMEVGRGVSRMPVPLSLLLRERQDLLDELRAAESAR